MVTGLDSRIHAKAKGFDSMGALLAVLDSVRSDFEQTGLVLNYRYGDGSWDSESELGETLLERCGGPPEERSALKYFTEIEVMRNTVLFHLCREAPNEEVCAYEERLLEQLREAERIRFSARRKAVAFGHRFGRSSEAQTRSEVCEHLLERALDMKATIFLGSELDQDLRARLFESLRDRGGTWDEEASFGDASENSHKLEVRFEDKRFIVEARAGEGLTITGSGNAVRMIELLLRMQTFEEIG